MPINIIDNYNLNTSKPIDSRMVVPDAPTRMSITFLYDGLKVFQQDNRNTYIWNSVSSTWSLDSQLGTSISDGYVVAFSSFGLTNSAIYSTFSSIAINGGPSVFISGNGFGTIPKEVFQINPPIGGFSDPLVVNMQGTGTILGHNWYQQSGDNSFTNTNASARINFNTGTLGNNIFTIGTRNPSDPNSAFSNVFSVSTTGTSIMNNNSLSLIGNSTNIIGTSSLSIFGKSVSISGTVSISNYGYGLTLNPISPVIGNYSTYSIVSFGPGGVQTNIQMSSTNITGGRAGNILIKGGDGNYRSHGAIPGVGGTVSIIGGYGQGVPSSPGSGGNVFIQGGYTNDISVPGDVVIYGGYNNSTSLYGDIYLGLSRLKVSNNDVYAYVHNTGTNGIGDSGNSGSPWGYPSIASGQFALSGSDFQSPINCSFGSVQPALWMRVGNIVSVCGEITVSISSINTLTEFKLTIPLKSHFGGNNTWQLNGLGKIVGQFGNTTSPSGDVVTIEASNVVSVFVARFRFKPTANSAQVIKYHYQYELGSWPDSPIAPITA